MRAYPRCRFCGQEILWLTMQETGKHHPVDVLPSVRGSIAIVGGYRALVVRVSDRPRAIKAGRRLYISHMATCRAPRRREVNPAARAYLRAVMAALGDPNVPMPAPPQQEREHARQRELFARRRA